MATKRAEYGNLADVSDVEEEGLEKHVISAAAAIAAANEVSEKNGPAEVAHAYKRSFELDSRGQEAEAIVLGEHPSEPGANNQGLARNLYIEIVTTYNQNSPLYPPQK